MVKNRSAEGPRGDSRLVDAAEMKREGTEVLTGEEALSTEPARLLMWLQKGSPLLDIAIGEGSRTTRTCGVPTDTVGEVSRRT